MDTKTVKLTIEVECADHLDPNVVASKVNGLLALGLEVNQVNLGKFGYGPLMNTAAIKRYHDREAGSFKVGPKAVCVAGTIAKPRVLVVVKGGIAEPICDREVDVEVFDWDNYHADPDETSGVPEHFADLAEPARIPVEDADARPRRRERQS
jgi:hypothetical protein